MVSTDSISDISGTKHPLTGDALCLLLWLLSTSSPITFISASVLGQTHTLTQTHTQTQTQQQKHTHVYTHMLNRWTQTQKGNLGF